MLSSLAGDASNASKAVYEKPKIGINDFVFLKVLGKGSFGKVRQPQTPATTHF